MNSPSTSDDAREWESAAADADHEEDEDDSGWLRGDDDRRSEKGGVEGAERDRLEGGEEAVAGEELRRVMS